MYLNNVIYRDSWRAWPRSSR